MRKVTFTLILLFAAVLSLGAQKPKYVFLFIGDGMGVNQIHLTEMYGAACEGRIGVKPLLFSTFPVASMATTYSASSFITDSSASGTAIACGIKTNNGAMGVNPDNVPAQSVAERAKKSGKRVGILSSVSMNHATPAAFYAHQKSRGMYYEIASQDLIKSGFEFFAGPGLIDISPAGKKNLYDVVKENGYTVAKGMQEYQEKKADAKKMMLRNYTRCSQDELTLAVDRHEGDLTLRELTESAIEFLMKEKNNGFFMMVEGGIIDHVAHQDDAKAVMEEIKDMDSAVEVAYEFYKKHPKETLIVVTADHDTGGLGLSTTSYSLHLDNLQYQKVSQNKLSRLIKEMGNEKKGNVSWDDVKNLLKENMGFWDKVSLSWEQEQRLFNEYGNVFVKKNDKGEQTWYSSTSSLAAAAKEIMNQKAHIGWTTFNHSAGYVPVYAIGAGQELFCHKLDNTDIGKLIAKAAGYKE